MNQPPSMGIEHMLIIWHQTNDIEFRATSLQVVSHMYGVCNVS